MKRNAVCELPRSIIAAGEKAIRPIGSGDCKAFGRRLKELTLDPYATRISKAVKMEPGQRTSRVGDWRIIYRVNEINQEIMVIAFRPRGKAYR